MKSKGKRPESGPFAVSESALVAGAALLGGRYTVLSETGRDDMTISYLCEDAKGEKVVVRECYPSTLVLRAGTSVVPRSSGSQTLLGVIVENFLTEAEKLSRLTHPGIARVRMIEEDNSTGYMVSDHVAGRPLRDYLEENGPRLKPAAITGVLDAMLEAVRYMHGKGILHRNLSPDSIVLTGDEKPVLTEPGLVLSNGGDNSQIGGAAWSMDSPYTPPEVLTISGDAIPASDLYSLSATIYHIIARRPAVSARERLAALHSQKPDPYWPLLNHAILYKPGFKRGVDHAMSLDIATRLQSADQWIKTIHDGADEPAKATGIHPEPVKAAEVPVEKLINTIVTPEAPVTDSIAAEKPEISLAAIDQAWQVEVAPLPLAAPPPVAKDRSPAVATPAKPAPANEQTARAVFTAPAQPAGGKPPMALIAGGAAALVAVIVAGVLMMGGSDEGAAVSPAADQIAAAEPAATEPAPAAEETAPAATESTETASAPAADAGEATEVASVDVASESPVPPAAVEEPTPAPVVEPEAAVEASATPALQPGQTAEETPVQPEAPAAIETVGGTGTAPATPASPAMLEASPVITAWSVALPFKAADEGGNTIAPVEGTLAPLWMEAGQQVVAVNGIPTGDIAQIAKIIRQTETLTPGTTVEVTFSVVSAPGTAARERTAFLPVVQDIALLNGVRFRTTMVNGSERTTVTVAPAGANQELMAGDIMVAYIPTNEKIGIDASLPDLLIREIGKGVTSFTFAVQRDGKTWVTSFEYAVAQ